MAIGRDYDRQVGTPSAEFGRRANAQDMGFAQGISDLAHGIGDASMILKKHEEDREISDAQLRVANLENELDTRQKEIQSTAQPGIPTADQVRTDTNEAYTTLSGEYKTPKAQQYVKLHGANATGNRVKASRAYDLDLYVRDQTEKRKTLKDTASKSALANPETAVRSLERLQFDYENKMGVFSTSGDPRVDAAMASELGEIKNSISWYATLGSLEKNPAIRGGMVSIAKSVANVTAPAEAVGNAIFGQESSSGAADTSKVNSQGVTGPMQIKKSTFEGFQKQGVIPSDYDWKNQSQNKDAGFKIVEFYAQKYNNDPAKIAAAYYGGEGAVNADGSINRQWKNKERPNDPTVGQYVDQVVSRIEKSGGGITEIIPPDAKMPTDVAGMPWWNELRPDQQHRAMQMAAEKDKKEQSVANAALRNVVKDHAAEGAEKGYISQPLTQKAFGTDVAAWQEYDYLVKATDATTTISGGNVSEQQAKLDALKPSPEGLEPGVYADRMRIYDASVKQVVRANQERDKDQISFARTRNFSSASPISTITDFSADEITTAIGTRIPQAVAVAQSGQQKLKLLDNYEAANLKKHLDGLTPSETNDWIKQVTSGVGDKGALKSLFRQVAPNDKSLIGVSDMSLSTSATPEKISSDMNAVLHGRALRNASVKGTGNEQEKAYKNATLPNNADAIKLIIKHAGNLNVPDGQLEAFAEVVTDHYVGSSLVNGQIKNLDLSDKDVGSANQKMFNASIEAVIGKKEGGTVGTKAGSTTVPRPYGMNGGDFMNRIQSQVDVETQGKYSWGEYSLTVTPIGYRVNIAGREPFIVDPTVAPYRQEGYGQDNKRQQNVDRINEKIRGGVAVTGKPSPTAQDIYAPTYAAVGIKD